MQFLRKNLLTYLKERMGLQVESIDDSTPLFSSGLLDSFSLMELIMFVESEAGVLMNPADVSFENLDSVDRIVRYVEICDQT